MWECTSVYPARHCSWHMAKANICMYMARPWTNPVFRLTFLCSSRGRNTFLPRLLAHSGLLQRPNAEATCHRHPYARRRFAFCCSFIHSDNGSPSNLIRCTTTRPWKTIAFHENNAIQIARRLGRAAIGAMLPVSWQQRSVKVSYRSRKTTVIEISENKILSEKSREKQWI